MSAPRGAKPTKPKAGAKSSVARKSANEDSRVRDLEKRLTESLAREKEALAQQTATSEILRVISRSQTDLQPVFDTIVASAVRLCHAHIGAVFQFDGELVHLAAHHNFTPEMLDAVKSLHPKRPQRDLVSGRAIMSRAVVQIEDVLADREYHQDVALATSWRSMVGVPMLRGGEPVGAIVINRVEPGAFADNHLELLQTFADQAVIAIENVRLFKELEERNRALSEAHSQVTEALEQQTVTADILKVISRSPTNARPVFDAILRNAVALCGAELAGMFRFDGELVHMGATYNWSKEALEYFSTVYPSPPSDSLMSGRTILSRSIVQITDAAADPHYDPDSVATGHWRRMLGVPLLRGHDPLGALVVAWRDPGETPQRHVELLQTFAGQAVIAIENVRLFRELEVANGELAAASQHKSEFLANMSHELRTPLNAIIGYSELLEEEAEELDGGRLVPDLQKIATAAKHQLSLINDILDLSKVEAGRMELELSDFDLTTTLDSALTLVHERAGRRGIALQMEVDSRVGQVRGDERKVRQVVLNLLSNAIKFTPEGGRIEVRAARTDGSVEVSVSDTGIGIAPEDQEKVFEEFRQVGAADKKVEGTGLGLALARRFVELHGGRIWVNSQIERGATFTFTLPVGGGG